METYMLKSKGFKKLTYQEALEKRKTLAEIKEAKVKKNKVSKEKKVKTFKYVAPKWLSKIPHNTKNHGTGMIQKKLWRVVSDYVRIRDFIKYGKCVATGKTFKNWNDGQAGHYKSYSVCHGMFKFDEMNIHLQNANSNNQSSASDGHNFGQELKRRYAGDILEKIDRENLKHQGEKITDEMCVNKIEDLLGKIERLEIKPDYYEKVILSKDKEETVDR